MDIIFAHPLHLRQEAVKHYSSISDPSCIPHWYCRVCRRSWQPLTKILTKILSVAHSHFIGLQNAHAYILSFVCLRLSLMKL